MIGQIGPNYGIMRRQARGEPAMKAWVFAIGMVLAAAGAATASEPTGTITARAQVIDGATLKLEGQAIRLWGIAVPAPSRADGIRSTIGLFRLVDGRIVTCHINEERDQAAFLGKC